MNGHTEHMTLSLEVKRIAGEPPPEPLWARFEEAGGSIGRREDNDWVLPDLQRFVSGRHALISFSDGSFRITDVSSNGVYINQDETPLGQGESAQLQQGDSLTIGEYEIGVSLQASTVPAADDASFDALDDPFARLLDEHAGNQLEGMPADVFDTPDQNGSDSTAFTLDEPPLPELESEEPFSTEQSPPVASESDHISDLDTHFSQPGLIPEDWQEAGSERSGSAAPDPGDSASAAAVEPQPPGESADRVAEPAPPAGDFRPREAKSAVPLNADVEQMRQALTEGLGLSKSLLDELPLQTVLENLGLIVRCSVDGVMAILRARSQLKSEFRMSQTMIRPVDNNPLKFSVNTEEALRHILSPHANSGYLSPVSAFSEAHEDIEAHMLAVMVGMQSALKAVLLRFKPENLQQRLGQSALLEKLPLYRRAKSWELYNEFYKEIANEAEDDFQQLFGRAFSQAYEAQIHRLASLKNSNDVDRY